MAQLHRRRSATSPRRRRTRARSCFARRCPTRSCRRWTSTSFRKHIYEKISKQNLTKYPAQDGVGSGPFTLEKYVKGQFLRMKANPSYWPGKPAIDQIVFRTSRTRTRRSSRSRRARSTSPQNVPASAFRDLEKTQGHRRGAGPAGRF